MIKGLATQDYIPCAQLLQTDREYCASLQTTNLLYYWHPDAHVQCVNFV